MKRLIVASSFIAVTAFLLVSCRNPENNEDHNKTTQIRNKTMVRTRTDSDLEDKILQAGSSANPKKKTLEMAEKLNHLLANEYVLYTKTWKFHWNVEGKHFGSLHLFFGKQVAQLSKVIDRVAERVRALDIKTAATLAEFLDKTSLNEHPGQNPDDLGMIKLLLEDHEQIIKQMHEDSDFSLEINDVGSNNLLCDLIEEHEKTAWMLRAFLS